MNEEKTEPVVIEFKACKHLDFADNYDARKQILGGGTVFWMRPVPDASYPSMVQFCSKRGRLNQPDACLPGNAMCGDYEDHDHKVTVPNP